MDIKKYAQEIFDIEIEELKKVKDKIGQEIERTAKLIMECKGKVVVTGIGKSGIVGKKIAATLASTGTLTVFMNSAEGLHGDLGMVHSEDVVIAISNSGNSDEVVSIIPSIKKIGAKLIAMTGNKNSKLAKSADLILDIGVEREACPMNLAPTCSSTATLVMGDVLASVLVELRGFKPENFAIYHPGGSLGRRLLTKVKDVMQIDPAVISEESSMEEVILKMTEKNHGAVCVMKNNNMTGLITEGDIRRALLDKNKFFSYKAAEIMTKNFIEISMGERAMDALEIMENRDSQIAILPVIDKKELKGILRLHDILNFG